MIIQYLRQRPEKLKIDCGEGIPIKYEFLYDSMAFVLKWKREFDWNEK